MTIDEESQRLLKLFEDRGYYHQHVEVTNPSGSGGATYSVLLASYCHCLSEVGRTPMEALEKCDRQWKVRNGATISSEIGVP